jgi:hypothetical protein
MVTTPIAGSVLQRSRQRLPDFVGIGTIKSGTTWLWACLREHPDIFMPAMKELEFFDSRYDLGLEWYQSCFNAAGGRLCGEISPQYMHNSAAFDRMRFLAGRCKLIVAFRNPIDRAFSHFLMDAREWSGVSDEEKLERFRQLVEEGGSKYVEFGFYARQLRPYVEAFGLSNIHVVLFDDIRERPGEVMQGLLTFLGVDDSFVSSQLGTPVNAAKRYRSPRLFRLMRRLVRLLEAVGVGRFVLFLKRTAVRDRIIAMFEVDQAYSPLPASLRRRMLAIYEDDCAELSRLIDRDLSFWRRE